MGIYIEGKDGIVHSSWSIIQEDARTHADACGNRNKLEQSTSVNTNAILIRNESVQRGALPAARVRGNLL